MKKSIRLVENRYGKVVPLKSFQISMTEGQIKFLLRCLENYTHNSMGTTQDSISSGFYLGGLDSIKSILLGQSSQLRDTSDLLDEYSSLV